MTYQKKFNCIIIFLALSGAIAASAFAQPDSPVEFGRRAVRDALAGRGLKASVEITITGSGRPESYEVTVKAGTAAIRGADANGALYGSLELAERIQRRGAEALRDGTFTGRPFLADRGWNLS